MKRALKLFAIVERFSFSSPPRALFFKATLFTLRLPQSTTNIRLTMFDHVSNYPKDCFSRIGEQLCAATEGEAEMCLIDGEKYTSRAQSNTLKYFFQPDRLLRPSTHGKGLASAKKMDGKILEKFCCILGMCSDRFWVSMGSVDLFSW